MAKSMMTSAAHSVMIPSRTEQLESHDEQMQRLVQKVEDDREFTEAFEMGLQTGKTDMFDQLLKDASTFIFNGREFRFDQNDPIFFRSDPKQATQSSTMCYVCETEFKTYKKMKYW